MNIVCVGLVGLVAVLWIKAERKASHLCDMCEKALDQRDELRAKLKEAKAMIALQREIIDEANNSIEEQYDNVIDLSIYRNRR
jgi:uncharacterized protein YsxB (DUF464 family)